MKTAKIGANLRLLLRCWILLYLLYEPPDDVKHTKKLHASQATGTTREATNFCATFFIMKIRKVVYGLISTLFDNISTLSAMKGWASLKTFQFTVAGTNDYGGGNDVLHILSSCVYDPSPRKGLLKKVFNGKGPP